MSPTPVPAPTVFGFEPDGAFDVKESWSYATDVITSLVRREKRIPLVQVPRYTLSWTVTTATAFETNFLIGKLWVEIDNRWYAPRWPSARPITNTVAGLPSAGVYNIDTVGTDFVVGGKAIVWLSSTFFDVMTVTAIGSGNVTLSGSNSFTHDAACLLAPALVGSLSYAVRMMRAHSAAQIDVEFTADVSGTPAPSAGAAAQTFSGIEVLPELYSTADLQENWDLRAVISGGAASTPFIVRPLDERYTTDSSMGWLMSTRAEIASFKQFLARRRGRLNPVWIPTLTQELVTGATAASGQPVVNVPDITHPYFYTGDAARKSIAFLVNGALVPMTIASVDFSGNVTLTTNLPVTVPKGATVVYLKLCRLSDDKVEMNHLAGFASATASVAFVEVASEVP